jgi:hypothetical protein
MLEQRFVQLDRDDADSYFPSRMKRGNNSPFAGHYQLTGNVFPEN